MKAGKHTCEVLKSIRKQIADSNGIAYTPSECTFSGECTGTCPNCERERQYLERQLSLKANAGKMLKIIGVAAGLTSMVACQEVKAQDSQANENPQAFKWDFYGFDFGQIPPTYRVQWEEMAEFISEFPEDTFLVVGHTDMRGNAKYNLKLSEKRAEYLSQELIRRGIDSTRIKSVGCGMYDPVEPNAQDEAEHERNRRVSLEFYSPERLQEIEKIIKKKGKK